MKKDCNTENGGALKAIVARHFQDRFRATDAALPTALPMLESSWKKFVLLDTGSFSFA
jgi:hypothetical protein